MAGLRLDIKRMRWTWLGLFFIALFMMIYLPARHDITAWPEQPTSTSRSIRYYEESLKLPIKSYAKSSVPGMPSEQQTDLRNHYVGVAKALNRKNYRAVNRHVLAILDYGRRDPYQFSLHDSLNFQSGMVTEIPYQYLVHRRINATPLVSVRSDAVNVIAGSLGAYGFGKDFWYDRNTSLALLLCIGGMCVCFGDLFTNDYRRGTYTFVRTLPKSELGYHLKRATVLVIAISLVFLLALVVAVAAIAADPDHALGDLRYPIATVIKGDTVLIPIWQYFARWWLLVTLWAVFIAGLAFVFSHVSRSTVMCVFLLLVIAFSRQLYLLQMIPASLRTFLPVSFNVIPQLFYQAGDFGPMSTLCWAGTLIVWSLFLWGIGGIMIKFRTRATDEQKEH
ncbi:hypothetical protein ACFQ3L_07045 [Lacticaseibacillus jixianensis]|uniref:ABC transporter permease n=1 Tax=Lacticaseibacillus jixianensis TaxID=2486012 RepID=A0ABW4BAV9_9LACO|nr:hypothetical protein [Lacticaseibacillus jixianensis]